MQFSIFVTVDLVSYNFSRAPGCGVSSPCLLFVCLAIYIAVITTFVAITCEPILFRTVSSVDTGLWSVVNVTCPAGQRLDCKTASILTTCNGNGVWDPPIPDCKGELHGELQLK